MYQYKNISNTKQAVVGVGAVEAGATVTVEVPLENPNFEFVGKSTEEAVAEPVVEQDNEPTEEIN